MKGLIFRYFSLLLLFLVIGVNLFGSEDSKGNILVSDKENIEEASEEFRFPQPHLISMEFLNEL